MRYLDKILFALILGFLTSCGGVDEDFEPGPDYSKLEGTYSGELLVKSYLDNQESTFPFEYSISVAGTEGRFYNSNQEGLEFSFVINEREDGNWSLSIQNTSFSVYDLRQYEGGDVSSSTFNPNTNRMALYFTLLDLENTDDFSLCIGLADQQ